MCRLGIFTLLEEMKQVQVQVGRGRFGFPVIVLEPFVKLFATLLFSLAINKFNGGVGRQFPKVLFHPDFAFNVG